MHFLLVRNWNFLGTDFRATDFDAEILLEHCLAGSPRNASVSPSLDSNNHECTSWCVWTIPSLKMFLCPATLGSC